MAWYPHPGEYEHTNEPQWSPEDLALTLINRRPDHSAVARFAPIDTDLNLPPSQAWAPDHTYEQFFKMLPGNKYCNSVSMGEAFMDSVPRMDLVGCGDTVKRLMLSPFTPNASLSLFAHRVGNSIYIDKDDYSKDILSSQSLRGLYESLSHSQSSSQAVCSTCMPEDELVEHLVWHSKDCSDGWEDVLGSEVALKGFENQYQLTRRHREGFKSFAYKVLPEEHFEMEKPAYLWEFHDLRVLVDTDLPIFGGGQFPSVSIKLSEEKKPISILTGMDLLLDQLMCNVPEVVMVYHQHGIVKEYEAVLTEELPNYTTPTFDPEDLKVVAENVMTFLSRNMTQQGHTYWLFREAGSSSIKLYDLTSLCPDMARNSQCNPFLVPVAMLLYKLSLKLMKSTSAHRSGKVSAVIFRLLNSAKGLLERQRMPHLNACIEYLLANLYMFYAYDGVDRGPEDTSSDGVVDGIDVTINEPAGSAGKISAAIQVDRLLHPSVDDDDTDRAASPSPSNALPNCRTAADCCAQALEHCLEALRCVEHHEKHAGDEALPFVPDGPDDAVACGKEEMNESEKRSVLRSAVLLRAAAAYQVLADASLNIDRLGKAYRYARTGLVCCSAVLSSSRGRHAAAANALAPGLMGTITAALAKVLLAPGESKRSDEFSAYRSYREEAIGQLAMKGVERSGDHSFSYMFFADSLENAMSQQQCNTLLSTFTTRTQAFVSRVGDNCQHKVQFLPTKMSMIPFDRVLSRNALLTCDLARIVITELFEKLSSDAEYEYADASMSSAESLYQTALELTGEKPSGERRLAALVACGGLVNTAHLRCQRASEADVDGHFEKMVSHYQRLFACVAECRMSEREAAIYYTSLAHYADRLTRHAARMRARGGEVATMLNYLDRSARAFDSIMSIPADKTSKYLTASQNDNKHFLYAECVSLDSELRFSRFLDEIRDGRRHVDSAAAVLKGVATSLRALLRAAQHTPPPSSDLKPFSGRLFNKSAEGNALLKIEDTLPSVSREQYLHSCYSSLSSFFSLLEERGAADGGTVYPEQLQEDLGHFVKEAQGLAKHLLGLDRSNEKAKRRFEVCLRTTMAGAKAESVGAWLAAVRDCFSTLAEISDPAKTKKKDKK